MRLWSIHPKYLDPKGLVALWREALLAQNVLYQKTKGYLNHPQLDRFKELDDPQGYIGSYIITIHEESKLRGYNFNKSKIMKSTKSNTAKIKVSRQQLCFEIEHLKNKLKTRDYSKFQTLKDLKRISPNPLFRIVRGGIANWERI